MGSSFSGDHIAVDHIHMDITTCKIEESQQLYRLGTVSNLYTACYRRLARPPISMVEHIEVQLVVFSGLYSSQFPFS